MANTSLPRIPLEDEFVDIVGKAQRGLGLGNRALAEKTGLTDDQLESLKKKQADEESIRKLADALGLDSGSLTAIARGEWYPEFPDSIDGLVMANTPFDDMTTNAYVIWAPQSRDAFVIDTGTDASPLLRVCRENDLKIHGILLTHTHGDHVAELTRLKDETGATAFVHEHEAIPEAEAFAEGKTFEAGPLRIGTRLTSGHSAGGTTFVVSGLSMRVAITGDSIFAGSMGGGMVSYSDQKRNIQEKILTLPADTLLFPGHGPPTSVEQELQHNPFFAR